VVNVSEALTSKKPLRRSVRVRVEGLVQGVGFRAFVEGEARALGLDGYVRNRRDGGVEAVFAGEAERVEAMIAHCRRGPSHARVDFVKVLDEVDEHLSGFDVRATL
jgi:acylphosphatase